SFYAHFHFGDPAGGINASVHGNSGYFSSEAGYFGAWISLWVAYFDAGIWVPLHDQRVQIANRYDREDVNGLGDMWRWKLDHWLATALLDIPTGKRVSIVGTVEFETSAEDGDCYSGVDFTGTQPLLLRPVVTGSQCGPTAS